LHHPPLRHTGLKRDLPYKQKRPTNMASSSQVVADCRAREEALQNDRAALEFMVSAQEAAMYEMQEQVAAPMKSVLQTALAKHQAQMSSKV
jgi:hypothetical protein